MNSTPSGSSDLRDPAAPPQRLTVVVPTFNRPEALKRLLQHLDRQVGGPFETIVVDDGGARPAEPVCAAFGDWVRCVRQPNQGPAAARNTGASAVDDGLICFTDDDCRPSPDWARRLAEAQGGVAMRMVGGRVENALTGNPYAAASQSISNYLTRYYEHSASSLGFFPTNNVCIRAEDFRRLGGFDTAFPLAAGEDRDFCMRWRAAGGELVYCAGAVLGHAHDMNLRRFLRQQANYGRGARRLHRIIADRPVPGRRFEKLGFYAGLLAHPLRSGGLRGVWRAALVAFGQGAFFWGYLTAGRA